STRPHFRPLSSTSLPASALRSTSETRFPEQSNPYQPLQSRQPVLFSQGSPQWKKEQAQSMCLLLFVARTTLEGSERQRRTDFNPFGRRTVSCPNGMNSVLQLERNEFRSTVSPRPAQKLTRKKLSAVA